MANVMVELGSLYFKCKRQEEDIDGLLCILQRVAGGEIKPSHLRVDLNLKQVQILPNMLDVIREQEIGKRAQEQSPEAA